MQKHIRESQTLIQFDLVKIFCPFQQIIAQIIKLQIVVDKVYTLPQEKACTYQYLNSNTICRFIVITTNTLRYLGLKFITKSHSKNQVSPDEFTQIRRYQFIHSQDIFHNLIAMSSSRSKNRQVPEKSQSRGNRDAKKSSPHSNSSHSSRSSRSNKKRSNSRSNKPKPYYADNSRGYQDRIEPSTKLFVTNIDSKFTQEELNRDLKALFEPFGSIKQITIKTKQGSSNSYCFIDYQSVDSAAKAQSELKGKDFKGKELKVQFGKGERKTDDRRSDKCYICHKEGHFAKDCKYNRFATNPDDYRRDRGDSRERGRDYRGRDYDRDHRHRKRDSRSRSRSRSSSSSSRSYRKRHHDRDRDDYKRRDRDTRRSPQRRGGYSSSRRY